MKTCTKCLLEKSEKDFYVKDKKSGRLHAQCKLCYKLHRESYRAAHYKKYRAQYLARAKAYRNMLRDEYRQNILLFLKDKSCELCDESDIRTLEFDHLDPSRKAFNISQAVRLGHRWTIVKEELKKCRILCANCHKKHTAAQADWYKNI